MSMAKTRRTGTAKIADLKQRRVTFTKRRKGLLKKASELSQLTGARVTIIVQPSPGKTYYGSFPSGKEINPKNTRRKGKFISPIGLREWEEDWVEKECDSCTTEEDFESVIAKYEAYVVHARKRLEDWKNNPSVKAGDTGVKVHCDFEILPNKNFDSVLEGFEASTFSFLALCKDFIGHGDCDSFLTSLVNSAAGCASNPPCSGLDDCESNPDDLLNLSECRVGDSDRPENLAINGGSSGEDPTPFHPGGCGYNPDGLYST